MTEFQINDLFIYPIKSLGGIRVSAAETTDLGFKNDRRWMLVDGTSRFISQREIPQLSLFDCTITEEGVEVSFNNDSILIPFKTYKEASSEVSIWEHNVLANEVSTDLSRWFSDKLNHDCRLVAIGQDYNRIKLFTKAPFKTKVSFADGYPYLILGTASLEFLNSKLTEPLGYERFRPNIVVKTSRPHEEDEWNEIQAGSTRLKVIKPCARCIITTIDQRTAKKGKEPLKTLSSYRKKGNNVMFGANAMLKENGVINNTDKIILI